ncbi:hypothetical protein F1188_01845 [Roseospira marina]|uniref:Uncharacterized protein n=1 Tax=Roseospira marina TaxID=140057 RepID=A0A5M6IGV5_9PROT|nr:hypothetical protein [Roseospira marina]KAA5607531.1 hypothetical protein F1188_01845 [Roseospira marina]MBB4312284.1 hypothetical protein [Roseospira marina]MBB5085700.1 hypothetical protein [Roseospira marina]
MGDNVKNPPLSISDFKANGRLHLRQSDVDAFGTTKPVRVVELPAGFRLFKLTKGEAPAHPTYGVTPWWSPVLPYREDYEGALGRYHQAKLNKIDMSAMVRYMSAVCIDWNDLDNYIEVVTQVPISAFWGTFAAQKKWSDAGKKSLHKERQVSVSGIGAEDARLPDDIGVLEAWQFFIPKLKDEHITRHSIINAHDMVALGIHFGFV